MSARGLGVTLQATRIGVVECAVGPLAKKLVATMRLSCEAKRPGREGLTWSPGSVSLCEGSTSQLAEGGK